MQWQRTKTLTQLQVHACPLDIALRHGRVKLNALAEVGKGVLMLSLQAPECASHVVGKGLVILNVAQLQGIIKGLGSLLVRRPSLVLKISQSQLQLPLASVLVELNGVLQPAWASLWSETLQVVADKGGARQSGGLCCEDFLGLGLGKLLQQALHSLGTLLVPERVDGAAGREVQQGLAVFPEVVVGVGAPVQSLDVLGVEDERGRGVLDNEIPLVEGIVASGSVGIVHGVGLAENGLGVKVDRFLKVLGAICFVSCLLQLGSILLALRLRQARYRIFVNLGQVVGGGLDLGGWWLCRSRGGRLLGGGAGLVNI